ncbi:hypothetical protein B0A51_17997 [Rachicladosporium sp. CCFEE 5018]|nr:hypothetical protein B0A51_17997 [Rachicladosporium sp. CCFEE 5018]OQO16911.1 hypothetical protein B0A51_16052 [Rachicladosporium sp. CCFEE 5018]
MSARAVPRLALRQSRWAVQRRAASTTSEATSAASAQATKAKEAVSETAGKAQQGLSRVTSSAGESASKAGAAASSTISSVGGRAGRLISFAQGLVPPTIYYAKVVGELGKLAVSGRNMAPPNMQTIQSYLTPLQNAAKNYQTLLNRTSQTAAQTAEAAVKNPETFLTRLRNLDSATLIQVGVVTAETIGFFTIGEIIGKFKIVGYRSAAPAHH